MLSDSGAQEPGHVTVTPLYGLVDDLGRTCAVLHACNTQTARFGV